MAAKGEERGSQVPEGADWKELFAAAEEFRATAPWEWMDDSHLFGVRNPWNGEIGWCVVLGSARRVFGLSVYRGDRGCACYCSAMAGLEYGFDELMELDCLLLEFCDRGELTARDLKLVKTSGLRPRGRRVWPHFRSFLPWHVPWYLKDDEVRYMTVALRQACLVAGRVRDGSLLPLARASTLLVREPRRSEGGWVWRDAWVEPPPPEPELLEVPPAEEAVRRALSECVCTEETWEVDVFPMRVMVEEGDRPSCPPVLLVVSDGLPPAVHVEAVRPGGGMWESLLAAWFVGAQRVKKLPRRVRVQRDEVAAMLGPTARLLGIRLERAERLRRLAELRHSLERALGTD